MDSTVISRKLIEDLQVSDATNIKGFFGPYRWLSNFERCDIEYEGLEYTSAEAAYQASKSLNPKVREKFIDLTPNQAKKLSKSIEIRPDWDSVKLQVMLDVTRIKYQELRLKSMLLETGTKYLEETNYWGDTYWGVCEGAGSNVLGHILMKVREEIKDKI